MKEIDILDVPIVTYCAHKKCDASNKLLEILIDSKFVNVVEFPGGNEEFKNESEKKYNKTDNKNNIISNDMFDLNTDKEILVYDNIKYYHLIKSGGIEDLDGKNVGNYDGSKIKWNSKLDEDKHLSKTTANNKISNKNENKEEKESEVDVDDSEDVDESQVDVDDSEEDVDESEDFDESEEDVDESEEDKELVKEILEVSKRAPSGVNSQPWKVYVVMGNTKDELIKEACGKFDKGEMEKEEYQVYPSERPDWYKERQRGAGFALYGIWR